MADSKTTREIMKRVSHQQARQLLHNKFILVLGDSIQRSVYKDLVLLLQKDKYLTTQQLRRKGEMSFEKDCLVEGGEMHNGTEYREVRQFQSAHHLVRFYFVTRIYSCYMQSILEDLHCGMKPDVVIVNSCVWDISRYNSSWTDNYKENLCSFFSKLSEILPDDCLVIWSLAMPLAERIKGGFLVPEIEYKAPQLRSDVIEANFFSGTLADAYGMDVLDLHFQFRLDLHHRAQDGVHWNALAHRRITSLLLQHVAQAWGVNMPYTLSAIEHTEVTVKQPVWGNASNATERRQTKRKYSGHTEEFFSRNPPVSFLNFEDYNQQPQMYWREAPKAYRPHLPAYRRQYEHGQFGNGFHYRPQHYFEPYNEYRHQCVIRSRHSRHHYAPYTHHRPNAYIHHGHYY